MTSIGSSAFDDCNGLKKVIVKDIAKWCSMSLGNVTSNPLYYAHHLYSDEETEITDLVIPSSVTSIGKYAFSGCSGLTSVAIPDDITYIGTGAFDDVPTTLLQIKRGTKSLLSFWNAGYSPYELGTNNKLTCPGLSAISAATQSSIMVKAEPIYNEYRYYIDNAGAYREMVNGELLLTGLCPYPKTNNVYLYIAAGDMNSSPKPHYARSYSSFETLPISPSANETTTASSVRVAGSYISGDADVTSETVSIYKYDNGTTNNSNLIKTSQGNTLALTGLDPNTSYTVVYTIVANGWTYTSEKKTVSTDRLTIKTSQPKVVSLGNVIVCAESNLDDEETNAGFEWRRTDWTDDFESNTGSAYLYDGTMEGYIRNLNTEKLWKYRPYYVSDSGSKYYGEWVGLDPTNTSYFEPTVHTYASIDVNGNTASVKGYAMTGTDKITSQGFKYWKDEASEVKGMESQRSLVSVPSDAMTVEANGQVMTANLTGLSYNATYRYVAFATTSEGDTYYGEEQVFETGDDPTGIEGIEAEASEQKPVSIVARYNMNGQQISAPQKGINILRMSDGTVKKVLVK